MFIRNIPVDTATAPIITAGIAIIKHITEAIRLTVLAVVGLFEDRIRWKKD